MKRIITYLYEYQNGLRRSNAGFFRLDLLGDDCRIQLNMNRNDGVKEQGKVYFVLKARDADGAYNGDKMSGVYVGDTSSYPGRTGGNWIVNQNAICGSPFSFDDVHGMAIRYPSGRYLASCWEEEADERFLRGDFAEGSTIENKENREDMVSKTYDSIKAEPGENTQEKRKDESLEEIWVNETVEEGIYDDNAMVDDNITEDDTVTDSIEQDKSNYAKQDNKIQNAAEKLQDYSENLQIEELFEARSSNLDNGDVIREEEHPIQHSRKLQRMDISDIRSLPKKNWHLCSNSFLIHGFFNYHYLVRKDVEEDGVAKSFLGVPGVYDKPERAMAMLFGFPEFEPETELKSEAEPAFAEKDKPECLPKVRDGNFGYWYCRLEE